MYLRIFVLLCAALLLATAAFAENEGREIRIFHTVAFRGNYESLPKWKRVLGKATQEIRVLNTCEGKRCPAGSGSWRRIISQARGQEPLTQLRLVNAFFNKWPYRLDFDAYGVSDWWATPQEFLKLSGDCEDYSIIKYFALRQLGFEASQLRIVVLRDTIRDLGHAILVVFLQGDAYVLDNMTDVVFSHTTFSHYAPVYSLNEEYRWAHIPISK